MKSLFVSLRRTASVPGFSRRALLLSSGLLLLPLLAVAGQNEEPAITLRMKFKQDEVTKYQYKMQMEAETALRQVGDMKIDMEFLYRYKTLQSPAGGRRGSQNIGTGN
jgi:hypothetical protein